MSEVPRPPAVQIMHKMNLVPDPWQVDVLEGPYEQLLLNCCRQAGKSTVVALLALVEAIFVPDRQAIIVSRSLRQSQLMFRTISNFYGRLGAPMQQRLTRYELHLTNGSRIISLPCREDTIRGYANVSLIILDEAARVPDDLYRSVRPMLAVSRGRLICLSTPHGRRGFFHDAWVRGGADWTRIEVPAGKVNRITPDFLAREQRSMSAAFYRQEYECSFEALEGLVFPDFGRCVVPGPAPEGTKVGGIDFGYHNPFAAIWGVLDRDHVLWLTGEHYLREKPLSYHAQHLPRDVMWYADPSGANEIAELRIADFKVRPGKNALRLGISAVNARIQSGTLRVLQGTCPNLVAEAGLYRYGDSKAEADSETPLDEYNHALAALRYLLSRVDERRLARGPRPDQPDGPPPDQAAPTKPPPRPWLRYDNEELWTPWSPE